jgi:hypothetical protein
MFEVFIEIYFFCPLACTGKTAVVTKKHANFVWISRRQPMTTNKYASHITVVGKRVISL